VKVVSTDRSYRIYLFAVCFVAVVCAAISSGIGIHSFLKIVAPEITLDTYSYDAHQSLDNFKKSHFYATPRFPRALFGPGTMGVARAAPIRRSELLSNNQPEPDLKPLGDEEIERMRVESYQSVIRNHRRTAMQGLIRISIILLVSCMLFFVHWRLVQKHRLS
jgi:hypothetical protein